MKAHVSTLSRLVLAACFVALVAQSSALAQTRKDGSVAVETPNAAYVGGTYYTFTWGYGVQLTQTSANTVEIRFGWAAGGFHPSYYSGGYYGSNCAPYPKNVYSSYGQISFANGYSLNTSNGGLTTTIIPDYRVEYFGTYSGNINDLGNSPSVYFTGGLTAQGICGSSAGVYVSRSSSVPLTNQY